MNNVELYKPSRLSRFLLWCSAVPYQELSGCSISERWKHEWQGMIMWLPPLMALVSMSNLMKSLFGVAGPERFLYAAVYGLMIFAIERGLIISMGHPLSRRAHLLSPALYARLVLALVVAFAVALPLKLELSKGTVAEVLKDERDKEEVRVQRTIDVAVASAQRRLDDQEVVVRDHEQDLLGEVNGTSGSGHRGYDVSARLEERTLNGAKAIRDSLRTVLRATTDSLAAWKVSKLAAYAEAQAKDLPAQVKALWKAAKMDDGVAFISMMTMLFFLLLEIVPLFIKVLSKPTELAMVMDRKRLAIEAENEVLKRSSIEMLAERVAHQRKIEKMELARKDVQGRVENELSQTRVRVQGQRAMEKAMRKGEKAIAKVSDPKRAERYRQMMEAAFDKATGRMSRDDQEKAA